MPERAEKGRGGSGPVRRTSRSEREKAVILDAMTELVLYLDRDMRVIWANKAMHEAFNLPPGSLDGSHCYRTLHGRDRICRVCPAAKTLRTGRPHEVFDLSSYGKNWVLRSYPVRDGGSAVTGVVEIVTDITDRRRAEAALRQSERQYRELFENANDVIFILDLEGRIRSCNAAASRTYGYSAEEFRRLSIADLVHPEDLPLAREFLQQRLVRGDDEATQEFRTLTREGETVWLEVNARIVAAEGQPTAIHGIARNITERKKMEEALRRRERELEEKSRNLEDANTALKVLLRRRDEDRAELEEKVVHNIRELILPYVENLKASPLNAHQANQLAILERHLNEITSPFLRTLYSRHPDLTPMELKIVTFIKEGRATKEMAELLGISPRTVDVHRNNIRRKVGLKHRKANLRSYLMAL
ncbi:MAG TPA: PAS domain S-box protein [Syntrophales bacterium]|nr:PAS domain S-box protein [Syntrophales bacterium]HOM06233.1 PAS domain S-box protein [Syntrophales bacterium]HPC00152.1 PAS domain S-box protein [Syntrophales bacterium]HPQ05785.1 PAS domain S-box protein [Syntrophales bacterium]HRS87021.1 PAS domain S-box protein [Syntrophales bacterium]